MSEKILAKITDNINGEQFGGKAYWLKWLNDNGFPIPKSYFSKAEETDFYTSAYYARLQDELKDLFQSDEQIALRSSGIQEDGEKESKAGLTRFALDFRSRRTVKRKARLETTRHFCIYHSLIFH